MNKSLLVLGIILLVIVGGVLAFGGDDGNTENAGIPSENPVQTSTMDGTSETNDAPSAPAANVKEFTVTGSNFAFSLNEMRVKKGDTVQVTFMNGGGNHDWRLDEFTGAATRILKSGESQTVEFVADTAGVFEFYCSVGSHRQMGMKGAFIVEE